MLLLNLCLLVTSHPPPLPLHPPVLAAVVHTAPVPFTTRLTAVLVVLCTTKLAFSVAELLHTNRLGGPSSVAVGATNNMAVLVALPLPTQPAAVVCVPVS